MKYLSVCSGIEAASVAWNPLGWEPVAFSEIEPFPCSVLAHHYPQTPNWGDMTQWRNWTDETVDVLVGGTPCQSFSVAGLRGGLSDPRGGLMLQFLAIAERYKPRWIVWENVPGVLSSNSGRDFGTFLGALGKLGYGWAYRVLDAQWFGVAQRRRRVFVVGCLGDQRSAAAVLFERESVRRDTPPRRETGEGSTGNVGGGTTAGGSWWDGGQVSQTLDAVLAKGQAMPEKSRFPAVLVPKEWPAKIASTLYATFGSKLGLENQHIDEGAPLFVPAANQPIVLMDQGGSVMNTLTDGTVGTLRREMHGHGPVVAFAQNQLGEVRTGDVANTINTNSNASGRNTPMVAFSSNMSEPDCQTDGTTPTLKLGGHGASNPPAVAVRTANTSANGHGVSTELAHTLDQAQGQAVAMVNMGGNKGGASVSTNGTSFTLSTNEPHVVAIGTDCYNGAITGEIAATIGTHGSSSNSSGLTVMQSMQVRRLTSVECERLQGFPDGYTQVQHRGKPAADGPRYKALGNSMAVPVVRWIGERINMILNMED